MLKPGGPLWSVTKAGSVWVVERGSGMKGPLLSCSSQLLTSSPLSTYKPMCPLLQHTYSHRQILSPPLFFCNVVL